MPSFAFFFFNDTATTEIYTLSLHDALPIFQPCPLLLVPVVPSTCLGFDLLRLAPNRDAARLDRLGLRHIQRQNTLRSEEHTSELQSRQYLVCRLLLEKKKQ